MKVKFYALIGILSFASVSMSYAQASLRGVPTKADANEMRGFHKPMKSENQIKTFNCLDTLRNSELKEFGLANGNPYVLGFSKTWNEKVMQTFDAGTASHSVTGIEFYGRGKTTGGSTTIEAQVVSLDANDQPLTVLATTSVTYTVSDTVYKYRIINFNNPATVTGKYGIILAASNTGGVLSIFTSDIDDPASIYEGESLIYDDGYGYEYVPDYTDMYYPDMYFFDFMMSPIVSYSLKSNFTINPTPICLNTPITFTATSQPSDLLTNKYYNIDAFVDYWFSVGIDSLYVFNLNNNFATGVASNTASKTYTTPGNHLVELYTYTGFSRSCWDKKDTTIVVLDAMSAAASILGNTTACESSSNTYSVTAVAGATGYTWTLPSGWSGASTTNSITVTAGATGGTISVVVNGPCGDSQPTTLTVSVATASDASFTYNNAAYCAGSAAELPVIGNGAAAGTFTISPAGLTINPVNGELDFANATAGSYTITNSISAAGGCAAASATATVVVNAIPTVGIGADEATFCGGPANATLTATGADTYTWSPAADLSSTTGATVVATPAATVTYTVTGVDANNCSNTAQFTITVFSNPIVTLDALSSLCVDNAELALTGGLPAGGTYSGTGVANGNFDPAVAGVGTFAITYDYTDANGCAGSATQNITVTECLGLEEVATKYNFNVFPIPATDLLNVSFTLEQGQNLDVKLYSMDAKVVYSTKVVSNNVNQVVIPVSNLASGVYYLNVSNLNHNFGEKVVIKK